MGQTDDVCVCVREMLVADDREQKAPVGDKKDAADIQPRPYTFLTKSQLRLLRVLLGLAAITSPLTATIYLPLLPLLRSHFHASAQAINLTLTLYIVFQAISPLLFAPLSDVYGRRPLFLVTLGLYAAANIGLAANGTSYAALLVLRAVQSLGASAAYAIAMGVVADVSLPHERGAMLGPISMALNLGACVGPVIGGVVAYTSGSYVWVFRALVIVATVLVAAVLLLLPETSRHLVGDGSDAARFRWWQRSWLSPEDVAKKTVTEEASSKKTATKTSIPFACTSLLAPLRILFHRDTALSLWMHGSFYVVDYSFVAVVPDIFQRVYGFNDLQLGLAYLPRGVGIIVGSYLTGRWMDHSFRAMMGRTNAGSPDAKATGDKLFVFPVERARSSGAGPLLLVSTATMVAYGWSVQRRVHPAVPLVLQFSQGLWGTCFYTTYAALVVDSFPQCPASASAATSVIRCAMAAVGTAVLQPLLDQLGRGWFFTGLGLWSGLSGALVVALLRWKGMEWRRIRNGFPRQVDQSSRVP